MKHPTRDHGSTVPTKQNRTKSLIETYDGDESAFSWMDGFPRAGSSLLLTAPRRPRFAPDRRTTLKPATCNNEKALRYYNVPSHQSTHSGNDRGSTNTLTTFQPQQQPTQTAHSYPFNLHALLNIKHKPYKPIIQPFTPMVSNQNYVWPGTHLEGQQQ